MKNTIYGLAIVLFLLTPTLQAAGPFLVRDGKTDFKIVLSDSPQPVEQTAAKELKAYLNEITGIEWTVASEKEVPEAASQILVGNSDRAKKLFPEIDPEKIPYDGIEIHLKGNKLLLAGHKQRGTLYAVNTFLEDVLGVRWWTSTEQSVPQHKTFELKPLSISYAPKLIYRESYYKDAFESTFATRMKCNGGHPRIPPEWGGHHRFVYFCHSFYPLIPPDKYFEDHPEWFSEINGVRTYKDAQLCLTNDEMRAELTKNALEALRRDPEARFMSISTNDWHGYCTCEKCNKIAEEEEAQSGPLILFVNKVAEEIEKEFPDLFIETLAYQYTRKPPKNVKPRANVIPRLCTIECSFAHPLGRGEQNKSLRDDIEGWSKISHQLFVWDYMTNFPMYLIPHPNYAVIADNIRFFVDHGTVGLFEQGDYETTIGDFVRARHWVVSKLLWDQSLDEKQLLDEFFKGYYGEKAAPLLWEYLTLLINRVQETDIYLTCFRSNTSDWLDYDTLCKATTLMNRAIEVTEQALGADSPEAWRLRREKMVIDFVWLQEYRALKLHAAVNKLPFLGPPDPLEGCKAFFALSDRFENRVYREYSHRYPLDEFRENLFQRFSKSVAPPDVCAHLPEESWVDYQEYHLSILRRDGWAAFVDDAAASSGRAVRMPGDHSEWGTSQPLGSIISSMISASGNTDQPAMYRVYVAVRCEAEAEDGRALTMGVWDAGERKSLGQKALSVNEVKGSEYKLIDLGEFPLKPSCSVWVAPPKRPGEVTAVYVDRMIVVRQ